LKDLIQNKSNYFKNSCFASVFAVCLLFTVLSDMMGVMVALAENLRKFRTLAKMSQKQLADRIGISCPRISEIELGKGNPTVKTLEKIATALQVEPIDLLRKPKSKK